MSMQSPEHEQPDVALRTADELLARPACAHIITMNNPNQNVHLERVPEGLRYTSGSPGVESRYTRTFASLDDLYQEMARLLAPLPYSLRDTIWLDISDYPPFAHSALYLPLKSPVELHRSADGEPVTAQGPYVIYGPMDISRTERHLYALTPTSGWLVVEIPTTIFRGKGSQIILRSTHGLLDRLRLRHENARLRRDPQIRTHVRPGVTVIYGKPPDDWHATHQVLPA